MLYSLYMLAAFAVALVPRVAAVAPTDSYSDADPAQSGYLPNHNMDPAIVDSSQFGQLWKQTFNAQEQVGSNKFQGLTNQLDMTIVLTYVFNS